MRSRAARAAKRAAHGSLPLCALRLASQEHGYAALAAGAGYAAGPSLQGSSSAGCWAAGEGGLPLAAPAEGEIALHRALLLPSSMASGRMWLGQAAPTSPPPPPPSLWPPPPSSAPPPSPSAPPLPPVIMLWWRLISVRARALVCVHSGAECATARGHGRATRTVIHVNCSMMGVWRWERARPAARH